MPKSFPSTELLANFVRVLDKRKRRGKLPHYIRDYRCRAGYAGYLSAMHSSWLHYRLYWSLVLWLWGISA